MRVKQFRDEILSKIDRFFSYKDGLLIECSNAPKTEPKMLICLGTAENPIFPQPPQICMVWVGERLEYEGSVRDYNALCHIINKQKVCLFNFTTTMRLEKKSTRCGLLMCTGCHTEKKCNKCPCKQATEVGTLE